MENHVKKFRTERKMTQAELSKACGIHIRHLQKLESGEYDFERVQLKTLLTLSDFFDIKVEDLYTRETPSKESKF